jgi:hypothetical protein
MILARADRELRALVDELRDDAAVAERLGLDLDGLIEAAEGRTERLFWTVSDPHQYPGPSTHGALAGAWFHGACAVVARGWEAALPGRLIGAGDLMEAIQSFEAESSETGDSRKTLRRYGMVRATLQPEFGALAPERAKRSRRFGSWNAAIRAAGFEPRTGAQRPTRPTRRTGEMGVNRVPQPPMHDDLSQ